MAAEVARKRGDRVVAGLFGQRGGVGKAAQRVGRRMGRGEELFGELGGQWRRLPGGDGDVPGVHRRVQRARRCRELRGQLRYRRKRGRRRLGRASRACLMGNAVRQGMFYNQEDKGWTVRLSLMTENLMD